VVKLMQETPESFLAAFNFNQYTFRSFQDITREVTGLGKVINKRAKPNPLDNTAGLDVPS